MVVNDFTQDPATGFWQAEAEINSTADICIKLPLDASGRYNKHVELGWKGNTSDPVYTPVEGSARVPANGQYGQQIVSEFYPVKIQVTCGSKPTYVRLTEH